MYEGKEEKVFLLPGGHGRDREAGMGRVNFMMQLHVESDYGLKHTPYLDLI